MNLRKEDSMLPPFIIEQIRKREQEEQARYEQPQLEIPPGPVTPPRRPEQGEEEPKRGVIILDLLGGD
jgi:hypothetical protein